MAAPTPVGRSSTEGTNSSSPKSAKRLSRTFNLFGIKDRIEHVAVSAPATLDGRVKALIPSPSTSPPESRSLPSSPPKMQALDWQQALQQIGKNRSPREQLERNFNTLLKILKEPEVASAEYAVVHYQVFPHIRLNGINAWSEKDVLGAIATVLGCMEAITALGIERIADVEPVLNLGRALFKNPHARNMLKDNHPLRDRWITLIIDNTFNLGQRASRALDLLDKGMPAIRLLCIALGIRQKQVIEKIKLQLHPQDIAKKTFEQNQTWQNLEIIKQLDLLPAFNDCKKTYFYFMDHVCQLFYQDTDKIGYCKEGCFEQPLSHFFTAAHGEMLKYSQIVTKLKIADKSRGILLHFIERDETPEQQKILARHFYETQRYEEALEALFRTLTGMQLRNLDHMPEMLQQLLQKGITYLAAMSQAGHVAVKEKGTSEENLKAIEKISQIAYVHVLATVEQRLKELIARDKNGEELEEFKKQLNTIQRSSKEMMEPLSKLYYAIEAKLSFPIL